MSPTSSDVVVRIRDWLYWLPSVSRVADWLGIISFFWTAYVAFKVRAIAAERKTERGVYAKALAVEQIDDTLSRASELLERLEHEPSASNDKKTEIAATRNEINSRVGETRGVMRAISAYVDSVSPPDSLPLVYDYYSTAFMVREGSKAAHRIRIVCVRSIRVTEADFLQVLKERLEMGCVVEIVALSETASQEVIEQAMGTLPLPTPPSTEQYAADMKQGRAAIANFLASLGGGRERYRYYETRCFPNIHMVSVDKTLVLGFQYVSLLDQQSPLRRFGIRMSTSGELGREVIRQFEHLRDHPRTSRIF